MANDMTTGRPIKVITAFAVPMFIGTVFQQIYNVVDSIVVGNFVGSGALAAVGACSGAFILLTSLITGLTSGMSVVTAQYFGAKDYSTVKKTFITSSIVIMITGLLITIIGMLATRLLLRILGTPEDVMADAVTYLMIMFAGTLANCLYNEVSSVLRAVGDSVIPLVILVAASLINVGLDLLFVLCFGMGVAGVALATVLAQLSSAVLCLIYVFIKMPLFRFSLSELHPDTTIAKEIIRIGIPAGLSSAGISISVMFMQRAVNAYGSTTIAGYTIGNRAEQVGMCLGFAIGMAVGTFCGQNIGARNFERVKQGFIAGHIISLTYTIVVGIALFIFAPQLAGLFTKDAPVIAIAVSYVRIAAMFAPVLGLVFIYQNFLRSAGDVTPTVWMSVMEIIARSVLAFTFSWLFGYKGIWWATPIGWTASAIIGIFRYLSGKWKTKLITMEQSAEN